MATLNYNPSLVQQAISNLEQAINEISPIEGELSSALSTIKGAHGFEWLGLDPSAVLTAPAEAEAQIQAQGQAIVSQVSVIEEYNEDVQSANFFVRTGATLGTGAVKFAEGFVGVGESIVDGVASAAGWVLGIFGANKAKESIGNFVKKDWVGDAANAILEKTGMDKYSYFSSKGLFGKICKFGGSIVAYSLLGNGVGKLVKGASTVLGEKNILGKAAKAIVNASKNQGAAIAKNLDLFKAKDYMAVASNSLQIAKNATLMALPVASIANVTGIGIGTQTGLQEGLSYDDAYVKGLKTGATQAGSVIGGSVVMQEVAATPAGSKILEKIASAKDTVKEKIHDKVSEIMPNKTTTQPALSETPTAGTSESPEMSRIGEEPVAGESPAAGSTPEMSYQTSSYKPSYKPSIKDSLFEDNSSSGSNATIDQSKIKDVIIPPIIGGEVRPNNIQSMQELIDETNLTLKNMTLKSPLKINTTTDVEQKYNIDSIVQSIYTNQENANQIENMQELQTYRDAIEAFQNLSSN